MARKQTLQQRLAAFRKVLDREIKRQERLFRLEDPIGWQQWKIEQLEKQIEEEAWNKPRQ